MQELCEIAWFRRLSIYYNTYQKYIMSVLWRAIRLLLKDLFFFPDFHKNFFPPLHKVKKTRYNSLDYRRDINERKCRRFPYATDQMAMELRG